MSAEAADFQQRLSAHLERCPIEQEVARRVNRPDLATGAILGHHANFSFVLLAVVPQFDPQGMRVDWGCC